MSELKPMTAYEILNDLIKTISTYHLDMGGKHKYCLDLKSHPIITKAKYFLETTEEKAENKYKKMWDKLKADVIRLKNNSDPLLFAMMQEIEKELTQ